MAGQMALGMPAARAQTNFWTRQFGTPQVDETRGVVIDRVGDLFVGGFTAGAFPGQVSAGGEDNYIRKFNRRGEELWTRQFGSTGNDLVRTMEVDATGQIYVAGAVGGALPGQTALGGSSDGYLAKYDTNGNELWTRQLGSAEGDFVRSVALDRAGNIYLAGVTLGTLAGQVHAGAADAFVYKYDPSGSVVWIRQFGTAADDEAFGVAVDRAGNVYVTGFSVGSLSGQPTAGGPDTFVRKYDSSGRELWTRQFGSPGEDLAYSAAVDGVGHVYVTGLTAGTLPGQVSAGGVDAYVRKYDRDGNVVWTRQFGTPADEITFAVVVEGPRRRRQPFAYIGLTSERILIAGVTGGALPGQTFAGALDAFVRAYGPRGNELWTRQFGTAEQDAAVWVTPDGSSSPPGIFVAGVTDGTLPGQTSAGGRDAFLARLQ
jgi:hypothetical protein